MKLPLSEELVREATWAYSPSLGKGRGSPRLFQLLGMTWTSGEITLPEFFQKIYPDDQPSLEKSWSALESAEGGTWDWEGRISTPSGWKWIRLEARNKKGIIQGVLEDITRTREMELRLKESENLWSALVNALPLTLRIVNRQGLVTFINASPQKEASPEFLSHFSDHFSEPHRLEAQKFLLDVFSGQPSAKLSTTSWDPSRGTRHVTHNAALLPGDDLALIVSRDTTEQHRWEHLQLLEQDRLQALVYIQSLPCDEEEKSLVYFMNTAAHLTGSRGVLFSEIAEDRTPGENLRFWEDGSVSQGPILPPLPPLDLEDNRGNRFARGTSADIFRIFGLEKNENLLLVPLSVEGYLCAVAGVWGKPGTYEEEEIRTFELFVQGFWEILHRKRTERSLIQSQKIETIGQMAAGVAHDFNNLLAAILGYTTLARMRKNQPDKLEPVLDKIEAAGQKGAQLVQSILNFGRKQFFELIPMDLAERLESSRLLYRSLLPSSQNFEVIVQTRPLPLVGDPDLLDQTVINLVSNARDALAEAQTVSPRVLVEAGVWKDPPPLFSNKSSWAGPWIYLRVEDNGPGIPKSVQDRLFEPFFTTKPLGKGTGLGLPVVKNIVTQHQGQIILTSEPGQFTAFTIFLPLRGNREVP